MKKNKHKKKPRPKNTALMVALPFILFIVFLLGSFVWEGHRLSPELRSLLPTGSSVANVPVRKGFVTDLAGALSVGEAAEIESHLAAVFQQTGITFYILLTSTAKETPIESFALNVFDSWRLGKKGEDRGLLLVVLTEDHKARFEVGYGLEGDLTDVETHRILDGVLENFKLKQWNLGVLEAVAQVEQKLGISGSVAGTLKVHHHSSSSSDFMAAAWWQKLIGLGVILFIFLILAVQLGPFLLIVFLGWPGMLIVSSGYLYLFHGVAGNWPREQFVIYSYFSMMLFAMGAQLLAASAGPGGPGPRWRFWGGGSSGGGSISGGDFGGLSGGGGSSVDW